MTHNLTLYHIANIDIQPIIELCHLVNITVNLQEIEPQFISKLNKLAKNLPLYLLFDEIGKLSLTINGMTVSPNWQAQRNRVIKAGKKTELLLKASKLQMGMQVIDTTAGFGHDSLVLASTGANVNMIEQNPIMFILLQQEINRLKNHFHWHKLISRLTLHFGHSQQLLSHLPLADVIYLDPMFPHDSQKTAQVTKTMQILQLLEQPPNLIDSEILLTNAIKQLKDTGRVLVKRPKLAPPFANRNTDETWIGDTIRFDGYFSQTQSNK